MESHSAPSAQIPAEDAISASITNAFRGAVLFPVAGPGIGAFSLMLMFSGKDHASGIATFFIFLGAYAFAGPAAALSGLLYAGISSSIVRFGSLGCSSSLTTAAVGARSGLIGMSTMNYSNSHSFLPQSNGIAEVLFLSSLCGAILGGIAGAIFPVGHRTVTEMGS